MSWRRPGTTIAGISGLQAALDDGAPNELIRTPICEWDASGTVITGALPTGMTPVTGEAGGVYLSRVNRWAHIGIKSGSCTSSVIAIPVPFRPRYPQRIAMPSPDTVSRVIFVTGGVAYPSSVSYSGTQEHISVPWIT